MVGKPAIVEGAGIVGIEDDRLVEIGDGTAIKVLPDIGRSPVVVGLGMVWIEDEGIAVFGDGPVVIPFLVMEKSEGL